MKIYNLSLLISLLISLSQEETLDFNPYEVLGVSRTASSADIRKTYKTLAKEWHPDKNKSPEAQDKFIKIQQAYEILSNDDKRQQYDTGGYSGDTLGQWQHQSSNGFHFSFSDFNHDFFSTQGSSHAISTHDYYTRVLPSSHLTPQVLYVYSTFCGQCIIWLRTSWQKASTQLENLGVGIGEVDMTFTSRIARSLSVSRVPTVVGLYKEKIYYFHGQISYEELKFFVKSFLPNDFVSEVTSESADEFLSGFTVDDKPRSVLFSSKSSPTLLYTLLAVKYQNYIKFGFVNLNNRKSEKFAQNFSISSGGPTLLVFKEDRHKPSVVLGASEMPHGAVNDILNANKYVIVPRLLSGRVFDEICPSPFGTAFNVKVCAILVTDPEYEDYDVVLNNLRKLVQETEVSDSNLNEWLKFMHVRASKQAGFVRSLASKDVTQTQLFILWRRGQSSASVSSYAVDFLRKPYQFANQEFQIFLRAALEAAHLQKFHKTVSLTPLTNELQPMFLLYALQLIVEWIERAYHFVSMMDSRTFMIVTTLTVVFVLSLLSYFTGDEEDNQKTLRRFKKDGGRRSVKKQDNPKPSDEVTENKYPLLHELLPSNYEFLILSQARGHMTAVLLVDKETELDHQVRDKFAQTMKIHCREPKVTVTYLDIEQYAAWYFELRNSSTAEPPNGAEMNSGKETSTLHGNTGYDHKSSVQRQSDFVSGTVLMINGSKHWYCIFVPRGVKWDKDKGDQNAVLTPQAHESHHHTYEEALSSWMDKLIGGQMPRLYVRQWPGLYLHSFENNEDMEDDEFE